MENPPKRKYKKHKEGYTISINHFLRKDKNFIEKMFSKSKADENPELPIYIRVTFFRQTAILKSRLKGRFVEDEFAAYLEQPNVKLFIGVETNAIRKSIEEFSPENNNDFVMSQWTEYYNASNYTITEVVERWFSKKTYKKLEAEYIKNRKITTELDQARKTMIAIMSSSFLTIDVLAGLATPEAVELLEQYKLLLQIDFYEGPLNKIASFTVWDWKTEEYKSLILDLHGNAANPYLNLLNCILPDYKAIMDY